MLKHMRALLAACLCFNLVSAATPAEDNKELKQIYEADQKDRETPKIDWNEVGPRDAARQKRIREMIDQGLLVTGKDYERAAMIYQHGLTQDDPLMAHILAVTAIGKGDLDARWLAAAALDRYLQRVNQPQVFGTQYSFKKPGDPWSMDPYNRTLISPALREANCVPDFERQNEILAAISKDEEPKPAKRKPCPESAKP